jgi:hypothetical protein
MNTAREALRTLVLLKQASDKWKSLTDAPLSEETKLMKKEAWEEAFKVIDAPEPPASSDTSDGYHTFDELYEFRKLYNAALFNEWATENPMAKQARENHNNDGFNWPTVYFKPKYDVHKSWRHHDGELAFGGGWFIVVAMLPTGQISNHYKEADWHLFKVPQVEKAKYEYDGHTGQDVLDRLKAL